jgi:hypothetical protein
MAMNARITWTCTPMNFVPFNPQALDYSTVDFQLAPES